MHVFGRTPMMFTKTPTQKGAVQISPVQKKSCDFRPLKMDGRANGNQKSLPLVPNGCVSPICPDSWLDTYVCFRKLFAAPSLSPSSRKAHSICEHMARPKSKLTFANVRQENVAKLLVGIGGEIYNRVVSEQLWNVRQRLAAFEVPTNVKHIFSTSKAS